MVPERHVAHFGNERAAPYVVNALSVGQIGAQILVVLLERGRHRLCYDDMPHLNGLALELLERHGAVRCEDVGEHLREVANR